MDERIIISFVLILQLNMALIGLNMILQRDNIGALLNKRNIHKL
jgi:hypothetical protein